MTSTKIKSIVRKNSSEFRPTVRKATDINSVTKKKKKTATNKEHFCQTDEEGTGLHIGVNVLWRG